MGQPAVGVYTGSPDNLDAHGCDAPPLGSTTSDGVTLAAPEVSFEATAGTTYFILVSRVSGTVTVGLNAREVPTPLTRAVFTPSAVTLLPDGNLRVDATLTCDAAATPPCISAASQPARGPRPAPTAFGDGFLFC